MKLILTYYKLGGNGPFRDFMQSYEPIEQGGYKQGLSPYDTYHCWAAAQYREKVCNVYLGHKISPFNIESLLA